MFQEIIKQSHRFKDVKSYDQRENRILTFASISRKKHLNYKRNLT